MPTQYSLLIGRYVMATAEHREPCDSRGSCTVLGAPEGEIPPGDSTFASVEQCRHVGFTPDSGRRAATQRTDASGQERSFAGRPQMIRNGARTTTYRFKGPSQRS